MCVFVGGGGRKHPLCFHVTYCPTAASSKLMCPEVGPKNLGHRHSWFCPTRFELTCSQARYGDETHQMKGPVIVKKKRITRWQTFLCANEAQTPHGTGTVPVLRASVLMRYCTGSES